MANLPRNVRIMEVGPRDGLQIEAKAPNTSQKIELIDRLGAAGLREIEVGSFVNPRAVPQMADTQEVFAGLKPREGVLYHGLWLNETGLTRALSAPHITVTGKFILTASDTFSKRNTNKNIDETLAGFAGWIALYQAASIAVDEVHVPAAYGCNYEGPVAPAKVVSLLARAEVILVEAGGRLKDVSLSDTMGWGTPKLTRELLDAVLTRWPDLNVKLHLHDTRGTAIANIATALEMGVREFDSSIGGLGGCPFASTTGAAGNVCTEDVVFLCEEMGINTGIDLDALIEVSRFAQELVGHELPGKLMKAGSLKPYKSLRAPGATAAA